MDLNHFSYSLDLICGKGQTLSAEHRAALHTSLIILKRNYKFSRVLFWGKIFGIKNDYFIAQGVGDDELNDKKYLYSFNCMDWHLLPPASDALIAEVSVAAKGHFTGDPSHEYEHTEIQHQSQEHHAAEEEVTVKVNEEKRLAVTVYNIDREVAVVPRGAYIKSPHGSVQTNRSFEGLNPSDAAKLSSYLHFSEARNLKKKSILDLANLNPSSDFLDPLSEDIPKGSWSLQFEQGKRVCVIRSLLWLGLTFFHMPMSPQHGYIYIGHGNKNLDLPFML
ncbi:radial spoke head protein 9 homolog [Trichomycterus rosablanca]|uniref:radial spoke head protein 9 homolog n=1 Tax=Trichomycterus rosablanca TaxID=2290929 RepID=UPI002F350F67